MAAPTDSALGHRAAAPPGAAAALDQLAAACLHPAEHQLALLRRILAAHSGVDLMAAAGEDAQRAGELSSEELLGLLRALPLTSWAEHYEPAMQAALAAADAGDDAELRRQLGRVSGEAPEAGGASGEFWQTSGTTGKVKVVPVTPSLLGEQAKVRLGRGGPADVRELYTPASPWPPLALLPPCPQLMAVLHALLAAAHPHAFSGLEIKVAFLGPARTLGNGWTVGAVGGQYGRADGAQLRRQSAKKIMCAQTGLP